ncbi:hypothetical protein DFH94DRAFT_183771 [Russula ochroleuca]|jgi:hypothetical protein|uniref:Uncharacterized protein n=1 Tax=Russula ochroleuca TaxID=152965 RepID=A0A9P5TDH4_9AGAM|nr:hypothetical protein DFH94DRAFT_183771 [Russula ochroleuca]
MASDNVDIPHIAIVGVPDVNNPSSALAVPPSSSPFLVSSRSEQLAERRLSPTASSLASSSSTDNHGHLSPPIPAARHSPDAPSDASENSLFLPHPSPTHSHSGSTRWAAKSKELRNQVSTSYPHHGHRPGRKRRKKSSTERYGEYNSSFRLSPLRSAQSDVTGVLPSRPPPPILTRMLVQTQGRVLHL